MSLKLTEGEKKYIEGKQKLIDFNSKIYKECYSRKIRIRAVVVFTEDSFKEKLPIEKRSYIFSNDNKAFCPWMGGYSLFASSLDGSDFCVRIENYMSVERGDKEKGWRIEDFYFVDKARRKVDFDILLKSLKI